MKLIECLIWDSREISITSLTKPKAKRDRPSCLVLLGQERFRESLPLTLPNTLFTLKLETKILKKVRKMLLVLIGELQQTQISHKKFKLSAILEPNFPP